MNRIQRTVVVGVTSVSETDKLIQQWAKQSAADEETRKAREAELRKQSAKYIALFGPYAAAAQAVLEGFVALGNLFSRDLNSQAQQQRALDRVKQFSELGLIPPPFRPDIQYASGYADQLEFILQVIESNGTKPTLLRLGKLFKKWAPTDPIIQSIGNHSARAWGMLSGQVTSQGHPNTYSLFYPERALFAARLASLDKGITSKIPEQKALEYWKSWSIPVASISDTDVYTKALAKAFDIADAWASEENIKKQKESAAAPIVKLAVGGGLLWGAWWLFKTLKK